LNVFHKHHTSDDFEDRGRIEMVSPGIRTSEARYAGIAAAALAAVWPAVLMGEQKI
jgi:hypothetical protein